jgi:hypothetical protein
LEIRTKVQDIHGTPQDAKSETTESKVRTKVLAERKGFQIAMPESTMTAILKQDSRRSMMYLRPQIGVNKAKMVELRFKVACPRLARGIQMIKADNNPPQTSTEDVKTHIKASTSKHVQSN